MPSTRRSFDCVHHAGGLGRLGLGSSFPRRTTIVEPLLFFFVHCYYFECLKHSSHCATLALYFFQNPPDAPMISILSCSAACNNNEAQPVRSKLTVGHICDHSNACSRSSCRMCIVVCENMSDGLLVGACHIVCMSDGLLRCNLNTDAHLHSPHVSLHCAHDTNTNKHCQISRLRRGK